MIEGWLKHKEGEVHHIREDVRNIKDMITSLLSFSIHHLRRLYHKLPPLKMLLQAFGDQ